MKSPLYLPSRCTSALPEDFDKPYLIAEEKMDGARYLLYLGENVDPYEKQSLNALLSRRVSVIDAKHVDKTENIPHIAGFNYEGLEGTVLDGEIKLQGREFAETNSIMNSSPKLAIEKQKSRGWVTYSVFDIIAFRGKDVRMLPLSKRRKILEEVVRRMDNEHVHCIDQIEVGIEKYFQDIVAAGGEGVIIKDVRQAYGCGWAKMKKSYDVSTVISGWHPGQGRYKGGVGSVLLSVYHEGELLEVGRAKPADDKMQAEMTENFEKFRGLVVDVYVQEISKSKRSKSNPVGRFRHCTFFRFRDDVYAEECTSEKLMADLSAAKVKNRRLR